MSRTTVSLTNATGQPIVTGIGAAVSRGSDWKDVLHAGTTIAPGATVQVGTIGEPGVAETPHWGWLYFQLGSLAMQAFVHVSSHGIEDAALGYHDKASEHDTHDERAMPLGRFGMARRSKHHVELVATAEVATRRFLPPMTDWMAALPDAATPATLTIPGTHDSAARVDAMGATLWDVLQRIFLPITPPATALFVCQAMTIRQQLDAGIRFLDLRLAIHADRAELLWFHHSILDLWIPFSKLLDEIEQFLHDHPRETLFASVKHEAYGEDARGIDFGDAFAGYWARRWRLFSPTKLYAPQLGDVRGRVVVLNRFDGIAGVDLHGWPDNTTQLIGGTPIYLQDHYQNVSADTKWRLVAETLDQPAHAPWWFVNFVSAALGEGPAVLARELIPKLRAKVLQTRGHLGTIVMDFPDPLLIARLVATNFGA